MSNPVWGQLQKALDDPETIEEAIVRLINEHAADPTAHLGSGESLNAHKTDEVIDHPAGSVVLDKSSYSYAINSSFESVDGYHTFTIGTGAIGVHLGGLSLQTGATSGGYASISCEPSPLNGFTFTKNFTWRFGGRAAQTSGTRFVGGLGYSFDYELFNGYGWRIVDNVISAGRGTWEDQEWEVISGYAGNVFHVYEIRYTADTEKAEFYIDGELVHTFEGGDAPTDADDGAIMVSFFGHRSSSSVTKFFYLTEWAFEQKYF